MPFCELWPGGPLFSSGAAFPLSTDSVLLSDFARTAGALRVCDLCCGSGIVSLLLLWRALAINIDCVELLPTAADTARENFARNDLGDRSHVITGDVCRIRELLDAGRYDLVVCNPPYFTQGSGKAPASLLGNLARTEAGCSIGEVCAAAAWLLRTGGTFCLVFRPERLSELLCCLTAVGLEPKRLRCVAHSADRAPNLVLVEAKRGGKPGLQFLPPLLIKAEDGRDSEEIKLIYHWEVD